MKKVKKMSADVAKKDMKGAKSMSPQDKFKAMIAAKKGKGGKDYVKGVKGNKAKLSYSKTMTKKAGKK